MERAPEVGLELVPDLVVVLVLAGADDAVAGAVGDDVHACPMFQALSEDGVDGRADADVAEEGEERGRLGRCVHRRGVGRIGGERVHAGERVRQATADCRDQVGVGKGGFDDGATHVACGAEDDPYSLLRGVLGTGWVAAQGELKLRVEGCRGRRVQCRLSLVVHPLRIVNCPAQGQLDSLIAHGG